jgi:hypothetical protein
MPFNPEKNKQILAYIKDQLAAFGDDRNVKVLREYVNNISEPAKLLPSFIFDSLPSDQQEFNAAGVSPEFAKLLIQQLIQESQVKPDQNPGTLIAFLSRNNPPQEIAQLYTIDLDSKEASDLIRSLAINIAVAAFQVLREEKEQD